MTTESSSEAYDAETENLILIDATIGRLLKNFEDVSAEYRDLSNNIDPTPYWEQRNALFVLLRQVILVPDTDIT